MTYSSLRQMVRLRNQINAPLRMNPFVFSKAFFLWVTLGIIGGIVAAIYILILNHLTDWMALFSHPWQVVLIMTTGGLTAGLIIHYMGDPGEMELVVNNIRFNGGRLDPKNNPSMILSSLICIASGGNAGPEAPLVQITGSLGSWLARKLRLKGEEYRSMSIAGMASGFTALFGAPLGGSLFALEILHHKHVVEYYRAMIPAFVSSCTAYVIFALITKIGLGPSWDLISAHGTNVTSAQDLLQTTLYAIFFGVLGAAVAWLFIWGIRKMKRGFKLVPGPIFVKMALAGLLMGLLVCRVPIARYFGEHQIDQLVAANFTLRMLLIILVVKMVLVMLTVTSGWRGGFIIPLFFTGATLGLILHQLIPGVNLSLMIVCCMAAVNACVTRTPISTMLLLSALTGYHHFVPIMFSSLTAFFLAPKAPLISTQMGRHQPILE